jgi:hypothetical protein
MAPTSAISACSQRTSAKAQGHIGSVHPMTSRHISLRLAALAFAATGLFAACGGSSDDDGADVASVGTVTTTADSGDGTSSGDEPSDADREEALLEYAQCMRDNGIDMPDPQMGEDGGVAIAIGEERDEGEGPPSSDEMAAMEEEMAAAEEECGHIMEDVMGTIEIDPEQQAEMREQMLEFAQCMRDHGIDFPDPVFQDNGRVTSQMKPTEGVSDDEMQAAQQECSESTGMPAMGGGGPGAGDNVNTDGAGD